MSKPKITAAMLRKRRPPETEAPRPKLVVVPQPELELAEAGAGEPHDPSHDPVATHPMFRAPQFGLGRHGE